MSASFEQTASTHREAKGGCTYDPHGPPEGWPLANAIHIFATTRLSIHDLAALSAYMLHQTLTSKDAKLQ
jgi:hypothetical protein